MQEEYQRDPPGQHSMPGPHQDPRGEERPGRHRLGPGPHPEEALRGAGPPRNRARGHPGLVDAGCRRGRIGPGRPPIGRKLRFSRPSSQQVPEEAEGGAGARAAGNSPSSTPDPPNQVTFKNRAPVASPAPVPLEFHHPPPGRSLTHASRKIQVL